MFNHTFAQGSMDTLKDGRLPQVRRLIRTHDNPTWNYALHVHPNEIELLYIAGGHADITLEQQLYTVQKGDILLVDKGVPHATHSHPDDPSDIWCLSATDVEFSGSTPDQLFAAHASAGVHSSFIEQTLYQLRYLTIQPDLPVPDICNYMCAALLVLYRQLLQSGPSYRVKNKNLACDVFHYINANYNQHIDLELLSKVFFSSPSHISREFKKAYHTSPINCLIDKRLSKAKWLLINTDLPLAEVAEQVGYQNPYYFTKLFSSRIGYAPSDYRTAYGTQQHI